MDLIAVALDIARTYGYLFVFLFVFLETSMLFPLLPSEIVLPAAAALLITDPFSLSLFVLVATAGAVVGSLFAYALCRRGGERALSSDLLHVDRETAERVQTWFRRYGEHTVLWGRLLPILRSVISIPAGFAAMNRAKFAGYTAVGAFFFNAAVGVVVYVGIQQSVYHIALEWLLTHPILVALAAIVVVIGAVAWFVETV